MPVEAIQGSKVMCARTGIDVFRRNPCIGREKRFLPVNEQAPIRCDHPVGSSLNNKGEVLVEAEACYDPIVDVAKIDEITSSGADVRLERAELGEMILKQGPDRA